MALIQIEFRTGELVEPLIGPYCGLKCSVLNGDHHMGLVLVLLEEGPNKGEPRLFHKNEIQHREQ